MNLDTITQKWLAEHYAEIPAGHSEQLGILGREFTYYETIEALEADHMEFSGGEWGPFLYCEPEYQQKKKRFLPTDRFLEVDQKYVYVVRDGDLIRKEYRAYFSLPFGTEKTFLQPDPDFYICLDAL